MINFEEFVGKQVVVGLREMWYAVRSKEGTDVPELLLVNTAPNAPPSPCPMPCLKGKIVRMGDNHGIEFEDPAGATIVVAVAAEAVATISVVTKKSPAPPEPSRIHRPT